MIVEVSVSFGSFGVSLNLENKSDDDEVLLVVDAKDMLFIFY
jgi:hypothetical protein